MTAPLALNDIVEVSYITKSNNQNGFNVWHYLITNQAGTPLTDLVLAQKLAIVFAPLYKSRMATASAFLGVKAQVISPARLDYAVDTTQEGPGDLDEEPLPPAVAGVVSLRTGLALRTARGRKYMPFPTEVNNEDSGSPTPAYVNLLIAQMAIQTVPFVFAVGVNTMTATPVVFSRKLGTVKVITDFLVRREWGTMRSRSAIRGGDKPAI